MDKRTEFNAALKDAIKSKDQIATSTIRLILAALKDKDIAERSGGNAEGLSEQNILSMLQTMIKQRKESAKTYRDADRPELAEREEGEIKVIEKFLPEQLGKDEIATIIEDLIAQTGAETMKDMGKVIGVLKSDYAGKLDMGLAGAIVKEKLG